MLGTFSSDVGARLEVNIDPCDVNLIPAFFVVAHVWSVAGVGARFDTLVSLATDISLPDHLGILITGFNQSARATASAASSTPTFLELPSSVEGVRKQDNETPSVDPEKQTVRDGNFPLSAASPPDHSLLSDVIFIAVAVSGQLMGVS